MKFVFKPFTKAELMELLNNIKKIPYKILIYHITHTLMIDDYISSTMSLKATNSYKNIRGFARIVY